MYDFLRQKSGEVYTGVYYESEIKLPLKEPGKLFRYSRPESRTAEDADAVTNLEYTRERCAISTTAGYQWKPKGFVVLGNELWRIVSVSKRVLESQQGAMIRRPSAEYILTLDKCNNAAGVSRL